MKSLKSLAIVALLAVGCANGAPTPQTIATVGGGVNLAVCILDNYAQDTSQGMSTLEIVADLVNRCGTDAVTVAKVLTEYEKAVTADIQRAQKEMSQNNQGHGGISL